MNIQEIKQEKNIRVIVPLEETLTEGTLWYAGAYQLLVKNAPNYNAIADEINIKVSEITDIERIFFDAIINEGIKGTKGFGIDYLKPKAQPYIELPKDEEVELYVYESSVLTNDTHKLIRLYSEGTETNPNLLDFETLLEWVNAYGLDKIKLPSEIDFNNYIEEE